MSATIGSWLWAEQLADAELQAQIDHDNGRCHLSEWSCSYCEREGVERVRVGETWARVIRDVASLLTLESWCLRWSEDLGAWLYFAPAGDRT